MKSHLVRIYAELGNMSLRRVITLSTTCILVSADGSTSCPPQPGGRVKAKTIESVRFTWDSQPCTFSVRNSGQYTVCFPQGIFVETFVKDCHDPEGKGLNRAKLADYAPFDKTDAKVAFTSKGVPDCCKGVCLDPHKHVSFQVKPVDDEPAGYFAGGIKPGDRFNKCDYQATFFTHITELRDSGTTDLFTGFFEVVTSDPERCFNC